LPRDAGDLTRERLDRLNNQTNGESVSEVGAALRQTMQRNCGVFRFPDLLANGVAEIKEVAQRVMRTQISDKSKVFNTARIEALELDNLIEVAVASLVSADARKESRGAHDRADFAERDDENWLKHTLWFKEANRLDYKPVHMNPLTAETIEPKVRTY
jgi:succinate dehydrogenase / fumarate reductase flavoprotein subunit